MIVCVLASHAKALKQLAETTSAEGSNEGETKVGF